MCKNYKSKNNEFHIIYITKSLDAKFVMKINEQCMRLHKIITF